MHPINTDLIYYVTLALVGAGYCIKSLELIAISRTYMPAAPNSWEIVGVDEMQSGAFAALFRKTYSRSGMLALCTVSMMAVILAFAFAHVNVVSKGAVVLLFFCQFLIYHRQDFGGDGSDQMSFIILLTTVLCFVMSGDASIAKVGLFFIAGQLLLSYAVAGIAKLASEEWRSGLAIRGILSSHTYGSRLTKRIFSNAQLSRVAAWSVILLECLFPLGLLGDHTTFLVVLGLGLSMHLGIAVVMGLNDFLWSFSAAYPSLWFVYSELRA